MDHSTPGSLPANRRPPAQARLRRILAMDAAGMTVFALAYLLAAGPVARALGVAEQLVLVAGALMLAIGAGVGLLASRFRPPAVPVRLVIAIGIAWALASVVSLALGWLHPSTAGTDGSSSRPSP
ncbi:hypothetical protein [Nonomuraea africana]|uniref:hypothetical protein n=1 Tax=Nonomuraea africana TaxID=46171 RepID=UPI0033CF23A4